MGSLVRTIIKRLAALILGGMVLLVVFVGSVGRERSLEMIFGPIELKPVDFTRLKLKPTSNQFLVCPEKFCAAQAHLVSPQFIVSPQFNFPVTELRDRWMAMIERQPLIEIITSNGAGVEMGSGDEWALQYDFIQRSELMRYPDSITVRFIPLSTGASSLAIYSRSHYGKSDFGVNEARIRSWLKQIAQ